MTDTALTTAYQRYLDHLLSSLEILEDNYGRDAAVSSKPRFLAAATWRLERARMIVEELVLAGVTACDARLVRKRREVEREAELVGEIGGEIRSARVEFEERRNGYMRKIEQLRRRMEKAV